MGRRFFFLLAILESVAALKSTQGPSAFDFIARNFKTKGKHRDFERLTPPPMVFMHLKKAELPENDVPSLADDLDSLVKDAFKPKQLKSLVGIKPSFLQAVPSFVKESLEVAKPLRQPPQAFVNVFDTVNTAAIAGRKKIEKKLKEIKKLRKKFVSDDLLKRITRIAI
jgi:hypothetical protein